MMNSSKWGWCGSTDEYCDDGCQVDYGRCGINFNIGGDKEKNVVSSSKGLCDDAKLSKKIIVYYPEWKYYEFPPEEIPFKKLTHINYGKYIYINNIK